MRTIEIKVFKFEELSEQAQETALKKFWDINVNLDWWKFTYDNAEQIGLKITGFDLDRARHATGKLLERADDVAEKIILNHGEICYTRVLAEKFIQDKKQIYHLHKDELAPGEITFEGEEALEDLETEFERALLEEYASILQNEYAYLTSWEAVVETIKCNEYEFTKEGKLV